MSDREEFNQKLKEISDICEKEKYIFRGEKEYYEKISSNLYRKYGELAEGIENHPFSGVKTSPLLEMERGIVDEAKKHFSPRASNIEVLTDLQHYGGETTLIDFTQNIYIALFFACHGSHDKDGRIILFDKSKTKEKKDVNYNSSKDSYEIIAPTGKYPRVIFQSSIFVHAARGYIEPKEEEIIRIPKELKREFLNYLQKHFHIERGTIYNDIHGFIQSQKEIIEEREKLLSGLKCQVKGNAEKAIKDYTTAIELEPENALGYYCRGTAKHYLGRPEEAIKDYDKALELKPQKVIAYNNRGFAKFDLGGHEEAIKDFDKALELDPDLAMAYYYRGVTKFFLNRPEEAIKDYDKALELEPQEAIAYNDRGLAKFHLGNYEEAVKDFDKALELDPDLADARENKDKIISNLEYRKKQQK